MLILRYRIGKKLEEEILKIFKELGYFFMILKIVMYVLGFFYIWFIILVVFVWMVDLIKVIYLYFM